VVPAIDLWILTFKIKLALRRTLVAAPSTEALQKVAQRTIFASFVSTGLPSSGGTSEWHILIDACLHADRSFVLTFFVAAPTIQVEFQLHNQVHEQT